VPLTRILRRRSSYINYILPRQPRASNYHKVPAHDATVLTVMHTTDPREAAKFIAMFEHWLGERDQLPIVGLDLEYTNSKPIRAALLQLCMRDHCLLCHISVATRNCPQLIRFLNRPDISFASVDKRQDTSKLEAMGARCNIPRFYQTLGEFFLLLFCLR
jgi:hypothetical protein